MHDVITKDRRLFIKQLQANTNDLTLDTLNMNNVLHSIIMFKDGIDANFYQKLKSAFDLSIKTHPSISSEYFHAYSDISNLLLVLMTNHELIERKLNENNDLIKDIETIDNEE